MVTLSDLEHIIDTMTLTLKTAIGSPALQLPATNWWVLVRGGPLDSGDFNQREQAREDLRETIEERGLTVREYVWVWDHTDTAQVVAGKFKSLEGAKDYAGSLREKGLDARVVKDFD